MKNRITIWSLLLLMTLACSKQFSASAALPEPDPDDGGLKLPEGFRAVTVADNLGRIRFISVATNGDIYVKSQRRGLIALRDTTGDGRADLTETFGTDFGSGTGVCVRDEWLYFSTDDAVYRYKLTPGELVPKGPAETIVAGLPPGQRQHESKAFAFDGEGRLYVEVGCPSNASGNPDRARLQRR
jgi:glucose/arabinose dehydrogenase